jgi:hypothetical protein
MELVLDQRRLPTALSDKTIEIILNHIRQVAPGLSVPFKVPRLEIGAFADTAGQFSVSDGWVSIKIARHFLTDPKALRAILVHELCHYILESSGKRKTNYEDNERLTDVCMFVCGLGQIFLDGYRRENSRQEYRDGHRLGYLTDAEYAFAAEYVLQLRSNLYLLPSGLEELQRRFAVQVNDSRARDRLISHARSRYPEKSDLELYGIVIAQLERDRR